MFSKEINDLINGDNLEVLKLLAEINPEQFKENVNSQRDNKSFFILMLNKNDKLEYIKGLLSLCASFGYDLKSESIKDQKNYLFENKNKIELVPEFVEILNTRINDSTISYLAKELGKEYFLNLEKEGWPY